MCTATVTSGHTTEHCTVTMRLNIIIRCCCCKNCGSLIKYDCLEQLAQTIFPALHASCYCFQCRCRSTPFGISPLDSSLWSMHSQAPRVQRPCQSQVHLPRKVDFSTSDISKEH